jgi:hypothetical protein
VIWIIIAALLGGLTYAVRGRGWKDILGQWAGTNTFTRPSFSIPVGLYLGWLVAPVSLLQLAGLVLTLWIGLLLPHAEGQDMGRVEGDLSSEFGSHTEAGLSRMYLMSLALFPILGSTAVFVPLIGLLHGPCYWLGWTLYDRFGTIIPKLDGEALQWTEVIWGAVHVAALAAFLVYGV